MPVIRLGYVHVRVTDLTRARQPYQETLGMDAVHEECGRVYLKSLDEDNRQGSGL